MRIRLLVLATTLLLTCSARAESRTAAEWSAHVANEYDVAFAVPYLTASGVDLKLDIYTPRSVSAPNAVVVYYHGGGWAGGGREYAVLRLLPYLEMGFSVVNVTYRGSRIALAPAAVEDCRCALRWVASNAGRHKFDLDRIVVTGDSAGSHLALMSGMVSAAAGFDRQCAGAAEPKVAAIVNWYGATDVADLIDGEHAQPFAMAWLGSQPGGDEMARRVSPLTYAGAGSPAVLTVHGDADSIVPIRHAKRLHEVLQKNGVTNRLVTIRGGGHGSFTREQNETTYAAIREFLGNLGIRP